MPSINRAFGTVEADVELIIEMFKKFPEIIKGVDFSGGEYFWVKYKRKFINGKISDPTAGNFSDYVSILKETKQQGLKLCIHCGEVKNNEEITEMLNSGLMDRIGHGTFIFGLIQSLVSLKHSKMFNIF